MRRQLSPLFVGAALVLLTPALVLAQYQAYRQGQITLIKEGSKVSWRFAGGGLSTYASGEVSADLGYSNYSADGRPSKSDWVKLTLRRKGNSVTFFLLQMGSGGSLRSYRYPGEAKCTLRVDQLDRRGVSASGTCEGLQGNPPRMEFSFSAKP